MTGSPLSLTQQAATCIHEALEHATGERRKGLERVLEALIAVDPDACWWEEDYPPGHCGDDLAGGVLHPAASVAGALYAVVDVGLVE